MNKYVIIPDSGSDLTKDLRERFDIPEILRGVLYYPDGHSELADIDWETMTPVDPSLSIPYSFSHLTQVPLPTTGAQQLLTIPKRTPTPQDSSSVPDTPPL